MEDQVTAGGHRLETLTIPAGDPAAPTLVLLHEGLGSISMWRDFPQALAACTGCAVVAYSRYGHGNSAPLEGPRAVRYMHDEALVALPDLLQRLGIERPVLVGHSDGASIAVIFAGAAGMEPRLRPRGLVLMAPHVFVEDLTVASIAAVKRAYETTDLPRRLGRHHADADRTFYGWNDIWLHPDFRAWNIEEYLPGIGCPVLLIQGEEDEYGTPAQLAAIRRGVAAAPVEEVLLPACGHSPHRDQPDASLDAVARFLGRLRQDTNGAGGRCGGRGRARPPVNARHCRQPRRIMRKPLVVDIPHQYTKEEAKRRIQDGIGQIRSQVAGFSTSVEDSWNGDQMDFRVVAVGQTVTGRIDVLDQSVRVEVNLPWVLAMVAEKLRGRIERQGALLLAKK